MTGEDINRSVAMGITCHTLNLKLKLYWAERVGAIFNKPLKKEIQKEDVPTFCMPLCNCCITGIELISTNTTYLFIF